MLQQATSVQFTVGKLDAGMAVLLSPDHHLIEFPATVLPDGVTSGSIINITIERNLDQEKKQREDFAQLQQEIYEEFSKQPEAPEISIKSVTQTSITVAWKPLNLRNADLRSLNVYRNGQKLNLVLAPGSNSAKLSGLSVDQEYQIHLVMKTSAGCLTSNTIKGRTHTLENLTGINVCFGEFAAGREEEDVEKSIQLIERVGASYTEELTTDNTHLICTIPKGPKFEKAKEWNIPIVRMEFLKACESLGKIQPVHSFYVEELRK